MSWTSLLRNPEGITSVYQGNPPDLVGVQLHEVVLRTDGQTLTLRLDLARYPEQPPRKWAVQRFNTTQVEISFSGIKEIALEGFGTDIRADVSLTSENGVTLDVTSSEARIRAVADTVFISKLTAYANEV
ncbi:hypothetical protein BIV25_30445 [Streptomyces sp. MUSC 14]|uniref:Imm50 family immunity protein n=1 Tax=Streptomyces sp. MUSC 14 TaxID=1354889 RepID=UPI0008F5E7F7|nr:Imm50 family immunity protein [Streptomyces sp. MUSC 14]OIJ91054.1 hypothetical protein BIV25_30445 [Streptomyces sp. MUSC 14]